jgi:transposase
MAICDRHGLPVAVHVASASPYEPHLVPATLYARFLADLSTRLIGDRGYDSDALDERLMTQYGIEMIAAHRRGRRSTQDGRPLRRARRRWKIERLFAWLHNSRRLVTRWTTTSTSKATAASAASGRNPTLPTRLFRFHVARRITDPKPRRRHSVVEGSKS